MADNQNKDNNMEMSLDDLIENSLDHQTPTNENLEIDSISDNNNSEPEILEPFEVPVQIPSPTATDMTPDFQDSFDMPTPEQNLNNENFEDPFDIPSPNPNIQDNFDQTQNTENNNFETPTPTTNFTEETTNKNDTLDSDYDDDDVKKSKNGWIIGLFLIILIGLGLAWLSKNKSNGDLNITAGTGTIDSGEIVVTFTSGAVNSGNLIPKTNTGDNNTTEDNDKKTIRNKKNIENLDDNYSINTETNEVFYDEDLIAKADADSFEALGHYYAKDKNSVYYKGNPVKDIEPDKFQVINTNGNYELQGILVTSANLLNHLKTKENREFLMTTIASVTNNNVNVKSELTQASVYSMDSFKADFEELDKLQRGQELTDLQRAKFGVIFLYIKLIKSLESDEIRMSMAKEEFKYFLDHSDEILKQYGAEKDKNNSVNGNIGYDEYCVYNDGELFGCFLNKIFISKTELD